MGLEPATCASWLAWCRWLKKAVWGRCGEEMAWMSSKLLPSRPWSSWHMSRYEELDEYIKCSILSLFIIGWCGSLDLSRLNVWSAATKKPWASWSDLLQGPWLVSLPRAQSTPWRWVAARLYRQNKPALAKSGFGCERLNIFFPPESFLRYWKLALLWEGPDSTPAFRTAPSRYSEEKDRVLFTRATSPTC